MANETADSRQIVDTPELQDYYARLAPVHAGALWRTVAYGEPFADPPLSVPVLWRYRELRPLVLDAARLMANKDAPFRVVTLKNPGRPDAPSCVGSLFSGIQIVMPGESATPHRHGAAALRFCMEGTGLYSVVE